MPPKFDRVRELDLYLALTLSIEQAIGNEAWEEFSSLVAERDAKLNAFRSANLTFEGHEVEAIRAAESRLIAHLKRASSEVSADIRTTVAGQRANRVYAGVANQSFFEQAG